MEAAFLGIIQGLTEWLPISSSGHLVIMQQIFGIEVPLLFDVLLHLGTILSVFVFFREEIEKAVRAVLRWDIYAGGRTVIYIIMGTVPVALTGVLLHDYISSVFNSLHFVGALMLLMGFILFNTRFFEGSRKLDGKDATIIGLAQAVSLLPGISRSGITISTGIIRKIRKEQAFVFSFMLSIPVIIGASAFELYQANLANYAVTPEMLVGAAVAAVVGYASLHLLRRVILETRFYRFAFYCWGVGLMVLAYNIISKYGVLS